MQWVQQQIETHTHWRGVTGMKCLEPVPLTSNGGVKQTTEHKSQPMQIWSMCGLLSNVWHFYSWLDNKMMVEQWKHIIRLLHQYAHISLAVEMTPGEPYKVTCKCSMSLSILQCYLHIHLFHLTAIFLFELYIIHVWSHALTRVYNFYGLFEIFIFY